MHVATHNSSNPSHADAQEYSTEAPTHNVTQSFVVETTSCDEAHENLAFQVWYPHLKDVTMPTEIISLSFDEAVALCHACDDSRYSSVMASGFKTTDQDRDLLMGLAKKIESVGGRWIEDGVFVRLSKRSPKDASLSHPRLRHEVEAKYAELCDGDEKLQVGTAWRWAESVNLWLRAMVHATKEVMRACSGEEALDMLVKSNHRIFPDLSVQLLTTAREDFVCHVVVRQYININPELEFRAFVRGKKLRAVSQYNSLIYVPDIAKNIRALKRQIEHFFDRRLKERLPFSDYVIDFAFTCDGSLVVIELNPLTQKTCACLFDWDKDSQLLLGVDGDEDDGSQAPHSSIPTSPLDDGIGLARVDVTDAESDVVCRIVERPPHPNSVLPKLSESLRSIVPAQPPAVEVLKAYCSAWKDSVGRCLSSVMRFTPS